MPSERPADLVQARTEDQQEIHTERHQRAAQLEERREAEFQQAKKERDPDEDGVSQ